MIKKIAWTIILQGIGTISSFFAVWIITNRFGLSVQGQFAIIKSWVDLCVVVLGFGLPQSFIYAINKLKVSPYYLKRIVLRYLILYLILATLLTFFWFEVFQKSLYLAYIDYIYIGGGIVGLIGHALFRAILLTLNDGKVFSLISILPAVFLLFTILIFFFINEDFLNLGLSYFFSGVLSFLIVFLILKKLMHSRLIEDSFIPWKDMLFNGFGVFLQSVAILLFPLLTYWVMEVFDFTKEDIGTFSISVYTYIILVIPFSMVAPLIYNKWSKRTVELINKELYFYSKFGIAIILAVCVLYFLIPFILPKIFGNSIKDNLLISQVLLFSAIPYFFNSLLGCALLSLGRFRVIAFSYISKTTISVILLVLFLLYDTSLLSVSFSWLFSEFTLLVLLYCSYRRVANYVS